MKSIEELKELNLLSEVNRPKLSILNKAKSWKFGSSIACSLENRYKCITEIKFRDWLLQQKVWFQWVWSSVL